LIFLLNSFPSNESGWPCLNSIISSLASTINRGSCRGL
jgi:hypothetical protein